MIEYAITAGPGTLIDYGVARDVLTDNMGGLTILRDLEDGSREDKYIAPRDGMSIWSRDMSGRYVANDCRTGQ